MNKTPSPERSRVMSLVKSKGNLSTEEKLRRILKEHHLTGWRRHLPLPGKPDFAFPKNKVAVFVDGCFWHGCPKCYRAPSDNASYWSAKVQRNMQRDKKVTRLLRAEGWTVLRIWEHSLRNETATAKRVERALEKRS